MSLEKEVFPFMASEGELFAFDLEGTERRHDEVSVNAEIRV